MHPRRPAACCPSIQRGGKRAGGWLAGLMVAMALGGCAGNSDQLEAYPWDKATAVPALDFKKFYTGKIYVEGTVHNRSGEVTRRFYETLDARWNGPVGTMDDFMKFDDGEIQKRTWHMQQHDATHYTFQASDIVGSGTAVDQGGGLQMNYVLRVPVGKGSDAKTYDITFDDKSWLLPDHQRLLNKIVMTKFGVTVGELTAIISKVPLMPEGAAKRGK